MNNHKPLNNEPRPNDPMFGCLLKRALLHQHQHQQDKSIDAVPRRSASPEYQITIEHGSIRIGQER